MAARGNIISVKISGSGTSQDNDYSYYIREENSEILLDAYYRTYDNNGGYREVNIEKAVVALKDIEDLRDVCDKYVFAKNLKTSKANKKDSEKFRIEAVWENKSRAEKEITLGNDNLLEIMPLTVFENIARRFEECYYKAPEKPIAEGNIVSLEFSYRGSSMARYTDYRYYLRWQDGRILFDAHCYAGKNFTKIILENATVTREDMEALLEICGVPALAEKQKSYAAASSSVYIAPPWKNTYAKIIDRAVTDGPHYREIFEAVWENGAVLFTSPPDDTKK
ncbi:MAG: hypothetical protein FWD23_18610, partial [Oscillospiraceae bacterium]|nr:hypothetical protein [Oscillospiraceae bacterium]